MEFVALNEKVAAFVPTGTSRRANPRTALNRLMTVGSWRSLIDFLKSEGCNDLFAKREATPLVTRGDSEYGEFYFDELTGSLRARIDKDASVDYLDDLTRDDLLAQGDVYELYIPELLSWREDISCFLLLAAVSMGATIPEDMFNDFSFDMSVRRLLWHSWTHQGPVFQYGLLASYGLRSFLVRRSFHRAL